jgi:phage terminase large subunit
MAQQVIDFSNFYQLIAPVFWDAFEARNRIKIYLGGAGSGKSMTAFSEMIYNMTTYGCNYLVVRQTANSNRTSTYSLTKKLISDFGLSSVFKENKTEMTFTCTLNGAMVYFRGLEDVERLKSISYSGGSGILERIIFEECSEGNFASFSQLMVRLRGKSKNFFQIILLLNPVSSRNWIKTTFYDKDDFDVYKHFSTFKDNPFIDDDYKATLESFKTIDENFYKIYALGQWGETKGHIFNNYEAKKFPFDISLIDESEILAGCDWGYQHPTSLTKSIIRDGNLYTFEELVCFEKTNAEFLQLVKETDFISKKLRVCADPEDPSRVQDFVNNGYSFIKAKKGDGSVRRTIDYLKDFPKWYIDPDRCPRLLQELEQYHWRCDRQGNPVHPDEPVKVMDDAIDSVRYGIEHLAFMRGLPSVLSGKKSDAKKDLIEAKKEERRKIRDVKKQQLKNLREQKKNR